MRRDGAANRERILEAAEQVFSAGWTAVSTDEVARRAGVGIATVFRHFPTKQDLLEATALRHLTAMREEVRALGTDTAPATSFARIFRTLVETGPTKVTLLDLTTTDGRELAEPLAAAAHVVREEVRSTLTTAQAVGAVRPDATVETVFTLARALALASVGTGPGAGIDHEIGIVLDGLGVPR